MKPAVKEVVYSQNQSTVGGQPFMPRGIFGVNPPDFSRVATYGFNVVQTYQFSSMTDEKVAVYIGEEGCSPWCFRIACVREWCFP